MEEGRQGAVLILHDSTEGQHTARQVTRLKQKNYATHGQTRWNYSRLRCSPQLGANSQPQPAKNSSCAQSKRKTAGVHRGCPPRACTAWRDATEDASCAARVRHAAAWTDAPGRLADGRG